MLISASSFVSYATVKKPSMSVNAIAMLIAIQTQGRWTAIR